MNICIMSGRLTADPAIRTTSSSSKVASFRLAVDRRYRGADGNRATDFFNCTVFGRTADFVEKYLKKGTKILVEGEFRNDNYTDKDGKQQYRDQLVVNRIEFAESKKNDSSASATPSADASADATGIDGFDPVDEDELPFN